MPDFFFFTGTRKNPLNIFWPRKLTPVRGRNLYGAGRNDGVASGIFPIFIKGWSRLGTSLTCRQGDIAEDLSEGRKTAVRVSDKLTNGGCHSRDVYKSTRMPMSIKRTML